MLTKSRKITGVLVMVNVCLLFICTAILPWPYLSRSWTQLKSAVNGFLIDKFYELRKPSCPNCNIILVSLDTLSANHLPCYGYNRNTAPKLCQFGNNNVLFKNMYSNSEYTLPSHVSIFTGLYPNTHKIVDVDNTKLDPSLPFLPEILHEKGYFVHFGMVTNHPHLPLNRVYNRGIDSITDPRENKSLWEKDLELFRENVARHKKTFMFLHTYYVHAPYYIQGKPLFTVKSFDSIPTTEQQFETNCSKEFVGFAKNIIKDRLDTGAWLDKTASYQRLYRDLSSDARAVQACGDKENMDLLHPIRNAFFFGPKDIDTPEKTEYIKALYDQRITELDNELASLFELINSPQYRDNTILVVTADHGEEFKEHGSLQHATLYDSNVRIPLMIHIPGFGHSSINSLAESVDLAPTILELAGINLSYPFQGSSLVKSLFNDSSSGKFAIAVQSQLRQYTIRDGTYKVFASKVGSHFIPSELYNTQKDPGEQKNLLFLQPEEAQRLRLTLVNKFKDSELSP